MKSLIKTVGVIGIFSMSGLVLADIDQGADQCPDHLTVDQMYDCIVEYGAGGEFTMPANSEQEQTSATEQQQNENKDLAKSEK